MPAPAEPHSKEAEQTKDDEDDDDDEQRVDPASAEPRGRGRDRRSPRIHAATAEVAEQPHDQQDDDKELDHAYLRRSAHRLSSPFSDWVSTADAVRATTKKLEKLSLLGAYFQRLDDPDLAIAARLFAGVPFPRTDERVLAVGWRALIDAVVVRTGAAGDDITASYQRHADQIGRAS